MAAHVLVMIAFVIVIATGFEGRVLFALGIAVVASGGWVAWLRVNSEDLWHVIMHCDRGRRVMKRPGLRESHSMQAWSPPPHWASVGQRVAATVTPAGRQILEAAALAAA
jgi:hypothetical protein